MKKLIIYCGLFISALAMMTSCGKSSNGNEIVGASDYIPFKFESDGQYGLLGKDGKPLFSEEFDNEITAAFEGIFSVKGENGTYSLYKAQQKPELVPGCEDLVDVGAMSEGLIPIVKKDSRISFVDKEGKEKFVLKSHNGKEITKAWMFYDGRAMIQTEDRKYGFIDKNGKVVVEPKYDFAVEFMNGVTFCGKANDNSEPNFIKIDKSGKETKLSKNIIPFRIMNDLGAESFLFPVINTNEICMKLDDKSEEFRNVLIDNNGKVTKTFPKKIRLVIDLGKENYIFMDDEEKFGLNNSKDETIIRAKYEQMQRLSNGNFLVAKSNDKFDIINEKDEPVKSFGDDYSGMIYSPALGFIFAETGKDKYELLDVDGNKVSQEEFILEKESVIANSRAYSVTSDYFNAEELAQKIVSALTTKGIGKLSIGQAFAIGDPKDYQTYTSELNFVNKEKSGVNINVLLNKGDVSLNVNTKEYVINYDDQGDKQFNPNAKIELIDLEVVLSDFKSKTDLAKSIIKNLKNKGYKVLVDGEYNALFAKDNNVIRVYCHERNAYSGINIWENNDNMSIEWQIKSCKESDEKINEKLKSEL